MPTGERRLLGEFGGTDELAKEPPINWLIKDWLPARELSVLYGPPGTFKSFVAQAWSLQLAKQGYRTLYIAAEGISGLRPRVDAWRALNLGDMHQRLRLWHYFNANVWLDEPGMRQLWLDELLAYLNPDKDVSSLQPEHANEPDLIVVDTLARNFIGDENSAQDMGLFVDGVERIRRALGCAILIVHHTVKGKKTVERGTEALRAASFAMFRTVDPTTRPRRGGGSVLLECARMKDGEPPQELRLDFDRVDLDTDEHGDVYRYSLAMKKFPPKQEAPKIKKTPGNAKKTKSTRRPM